MNHPAPFLLSLSPRSGAPQRRRRVPLTLGVSTVIAALCVGAGDLAPPAMGQSAAPEFVARESGSTSQAAESSADTDEQFSQVNLLEQMTTTGIALTSDVSYILPTPTFVSITGESIDPASARKSLEKIAGPQGVRRFTRDSVVAPLAVRTDAISNEAGQRIGHFINATFVVHQSIAEIRQSKVLDDFKSDADTDPESETITFVEDDTADEFETTTSRSLSATELSQHDVTLDKNSETLGYLQLPLLGKIVLRGVARARRSVWSSDDPSAPVILTWLVDSRFGSASPQADSIANQWRAIERTEVGRRVLGPPHPYEGLGGYVAIAPLPGDATASIVQIRFVLHEPPDWFHGRNLLRSKLPLLIQDRVRNIRRQLQD